MDQIGHNGPNYTKLDQDAPNRMDQSRPIWTEVDLFGPNWTEVGVYYLYLLKLIKMTYGSLTRPLNLVLDTILTYEYSSGIKYFSSEHKLKINKWCLHLSYLYYMFFLL